MSFRLSGWILPGLLGNMIVLLGLGLSMYFLDSSRRKFEIGIEDNSDFQYQLNEFLLAFAEEERSFLHIFLTEDTLNKKPDTQIINTAQRALFEMEKLSVRDSSVYEKVIQLGKIHNQLYSHYRVLTREDNLSSMDSIRGKKIMHLLKIAADSVPQIINSLRISISKKKENLIVQFNEIEFWLRPIGFVFFLICFLLLFVVFFIIRYYFHQTLKYITQLNEERGLLQVVMDNATGPVLIKDINGKYLYTNKKFDALFDVKTGASRGKTDLELMPADLSGRNLTSDLEVLKSGKRLKYEETYSRNHSQATYYVEKFPVKNESGVTYAIGLLAVDISEKSKSDLELMRNEQFFRGIVEAMPVSLLVMDTENRIQYINKRFESFFGYSTAELLDKSMSELMMPPRYWEQHKKGMKNYIQTGKGVVLDRTMEVEAISKNSHELEVALNVSELKIAGKNYFVGLFHSIAEKKKVEREMKELNDFLNSVIENIPDMIFVKDPDNLRFVRVNKAAEKLLGKNRNELIGKSDLDFFPKSQAEFFMQKDKEVLERGGILDIPEEEIDVPSGKRWLHTKKIAIKNHLNLHRYLLGISEDITEFKLQEEARDRVEKNLKASEHRLSLILDNIGEGVIVTDADQVVLLYNHMAAEIFGSSQSEYFSQWAKAFEIFESDGKALFPAQNLPLEKAVRGEDTEEQELKMIRLSDNAVKWVKVNGRFIVDEGNHVVAAVATIREFTRQKQLEQTLRDTELKYRKMIGFGRNANEEKI